MNNRVKARMFAFDLKADTVVSVSSLGDQTLKTDWYRCYFKEEIKVITDIVGREVTTSLQIYVPDDIIEKIAVSSTLSITRDRKATDIEYIHQNKTIYKRDAFYGPGAVTMLGVLYCP